jgi:Na+-driven multidrug efflux pump/anti-sigma regulatory factor (Ser/Thr protein kinase)
MNRNDRLIKKKIYRYMLTGIMMTVALQLGNVVDAMIVGNLLGSGGNGAVSASLPYVFLLQAATVLLSGGGAVTAAVSLGKRDAESAGKVMGFCLLAGLVYPLLFTAASPVIVPWYVRFTSAQGELAQMVGDFTFVHSLGMPVISFVLIMSHFMSADNHPSIAAGMNIAANAVNLVLDYILVKYTSLGIKGAALSTSLGYLAAGLIFIPLYLKSDKRMIKLPRGGFSGMKELVLPTVKGGLSNLTSLVLTVAGMAILNRKLLEALGSGYYSAYAVTNNTQAVVNMFLNGITSVIASVAGVLCGEKDYYGMRAVLSRVLKTALIIGAVITALFLAFPQAIAAMYGFNDPEIIPALKTGLRLFSLSFGFFILNSVTQNYYRTAGQTFLSVAVTALELLIIKIPLMLMGLDRFGFTGLFAAVILSEALSFVTINLIRIAMQKKGKVPHKGFMAIPERCESEICDISLIGDDRSAAEASKKIIGCCLKENMTLKQANLLGLAAEELVSNIGRYGYGGGKCRGRDIDICLSKNGDLYYLRIRDGGIPFNPVSYKPGQHGADSVGGLDMLKKTALKLS